MFDNDLKTVQNSSNFSTEEDFDKRLGGALFLCTQCMQVVLTCDRIFFFVESHVFGSALVGIFFPLSCFYPSFVANLKNALESLCFPNHDALDFLSG